jgi:hypothetical protein
MAATDEDKALRMSVLQGSSNLSRALNLVGHRRESEHICSKMPDSFD